MIRAHIVHRHLALSSQYAEAKTEKRISIISLVDDERHVLESHLVGFPDRLDHSMDVARRLVAEHRIRERHERAVTTVMATIARVHFGAENSSTPPPLDYFLPDPHRGTPR